MLNHQQKNDELRLRWCMATFLLMYWSWNWLFLIQMIPKKNSKSKSIENHLLRILLWNLRWVLLLSCTSWCAFVIGFNNQSPFGSSEVYNNKFTTRQKISGKNSILKRSLQVHFLFIYLFKWLPNIFLSFRFRFFFY